MDLDELAAVRVDASYQPIGASAVLYNTGIRVSGLLTLQDKFRSGIQWAGYLVGGEVDER